MQEAGLRITFIHTACVYVHDTRAREQASRNRQVKQCGQGPSACQTTLYSPVWMNLGSPPGLRWPEENILRLVTSRGWASTVMHVAAADGARGNGKSWEDFLDLGSPGKEGSPFAWGPLADDAHLHPLTDPHSLAIWKDETVARSELAGSRALIRTSRIFI